MDIFILKTGQRVLKGFMSFKHLGGGIALWNIQDYSFENGNSQIIGIKATREKFEVIFYHFHYVRFYSNKLARFATQVELGRINLADDVIYIFYKPFVKLLIQLKRKIFLVDSSFDPNGSSKKLINWK